MNQRTIRAKQIIEMERHASQTALDKFKVRSQSNPELRYTVTRTDNGLVCECLDHTTRNADCKHIKVILQYIKKNVFSHDRFRIMERSKLNLCKYCDSGNIKKMGFRKTQNGRIQVYGCKDCKKRFTTNFGFEKMRYDPRTITQAIRCITKE